MPAAQGASVTAYTDYAQQNALTFASAFKKTSDKG
jgi:hypothetical protein